MGSRLSPSRWEVSRWRLIFSKIRVIKILRRHSLALLGDEIARGLSLIGANANYDFAYAGQHVLRHFRISNQSLNALRFEQALHHHCFRFVFSIEDGYQFIVKG